MHRVPHFIADDVVQVTVIAIPSLHMPMLLEILIGLRAGGAGVIDVYKCAHGVESSALTILAVVTQRDPTRYHVYFRGVH